MLAATILLVATNAGVIGASRITYAMASYRQLPEVFRRLHKSFGDAVAGARRLRGDRLDRGHPARPDELPGDDVRVRRDALVHDRPRGGRRAPGQGARTRSSSTARRPNLRLGGIDWPLFAILGGFGTAAAWIVIVVQEQATRLVGLGWLAIGFVVYALYRRRLHLPLRQTVRAPAIVLGLEVEYRTILVPVLRTAESEEALVAAARLASERRARIVILHVLEVPLDRRSTRSSPSARRSPIRSSTRRRRSSRRYAGVQITSRLERARSAGPAIVAEAARRDAEVVILGAPRTKVKGGKPIFGRTVDYVLRNAPTRVAVVAGKQAA